MEFFTYELTQKSALNRVDLSSLREGIIIRHNGGYGCVHPWAELGDPTLEECLKDLRRAEDGRSGNPLIQRALDATEVVSAEMFRGRGGEVTDKGSLSNVFLSHATLPRMTGTEVAAAVEAGFTAVKVKRGKDWMRMRKKTAQMMEAYPQLRWRIDFNGALEKPLELRQFLGSVPAERIDFIEDPFSDAKEAEKWRGVPIGYDRVIPEKVNLENGFLIAKPALQSRAEVRELAGEFPERVVFTSYMDHPVGQLCAYLEAERYYLENGVTEPPLCGLVTQGLYEETVYSRALGAAAPQLSLPSFNALEALLVQESWKDI